MPPTVVLLVEDGEHLPVLVLDVVEVGCAECGRGRVEVDGVAGRGEAVLPAGLHVRHLERPARRLHGAAGLRGLGAEHARHALAQQIAHCRTNPLNTLERHGDTHCTDTYITDTHFTLRKRSIPHITEIH